MNKNRHGKFTVANFRDSFKLKYPLKYQLVNSYSSHK